MWWLWERNNKNNIYKENAKIVLKNKLKANFRFYLFCSKYPLIRTEKVAITRRVQLSFSLFFKPLWLPNSPATLDELHSHHSYTNHTDYGGYNCAADSVSCLNIRPLPSAWDRAPVRFQHLDQKLERKPEFSSRSNNKTWELISIKVSAPLLLQTWLCS